MGKRGPRPVAEKVVNALEGAGLEEAAAVAREAAGLPPLPRTWQQDFIFAVRDHVDPGGPVGFNPTPGLSDERAEAEADERESILRGLTPPKGRKYSWKRTGNRIEVKVV